MASRTRVVPKSVPKIVLTVAATAFLILLVACGSSTPKGAPPPTGGFGNSNLSGTYAFSTVGTDINFAIVAFAGTFTANGSGQITGGTIDVMEPGVGLTQGGVAVTGGSYNVGPDGRPTSQGGLLTLNTQQDGAFTFDYVLSSKSGGLITYYAANNNDPGSGSGSFQLQTSVTQSSINGQSYSFSTSGVSSSASVAMAGAFTLDANGNVTTGTGIEDLNIGGTGVPCGTAGCSMSAGNITLSTTAGAPGSASFTSTATPSPLTFDVYPVSPSQLIFIETDGTYIATGTAFTQATSIPVGNNVYSVAGLDLVTPDPNTGTPPTPIASTGLLVTGSGNTITNASTQDVNDAGTPSTTPVTFTGNYNPQLISGRSTITLNGFVNQGGAGCSSCTFAIYPFFSGGVTGMQILEIDGAGFTSGIAYAQSATTFASGQGYGLNLTGINLLSTDAEEDDIAEFSYGGSSTCGGGANLCGLIDFNDIVAGSTSFAQGYTGAYAADTSGIPGRGTVTGGNNAYGMASYVVDGSTSLAVVNDQSGMVAVGTLTTQSATSAASASAVQQHLIAIRAASIAGKRMKKNKSR